MKIWYNTKFDGHYPVGSAAIVSAKTSKDAALVLQTALRECGLAQKVKPSDMKQFDTRIGCFAILCDGNY